MAPQGVLLALIDIRVLQCLCSLLFFALPHLQCLCSTSGNTFNAYAVFFSLHSLTTCMPSLCSVCLPQQQTLGTHSHVPRAGGTQHLYCNLQTHLYYKHTCAANTPVLQTHLCCKHTCIANTHVLQTHMYCKHTCNANTPVVQTHLCRSLLVAVLCNLLVFFMQLIHGQQLNAMQYFLQVCTPSRSRLDPYVGKEENVLSLPKPTLLHNVLFIVCR